MQIDDVNKRGPSRAAGELGGGAAGSGGGGGNGNDDRQLCVKDGRLKKTVICRAFLRARGRVAFACALKATRPRLARLRAASRKAAGRLGGKGKSGSQKGGQPKGGQQEGGPGEGKRGKSGNGKDKGTDKTKKGRGRAKTKTHADAPREQSWRCRRRWCSEEVLPWWSIRQIGGPRTRRVGLRSQSSRQRRAASIGGTTWASVPSAPGARSQPA